MKEATAKERELAQALDKEQFEEIKKYAKIQENLKYLQLTDQQREAWREAESKIYPEFYNKTSYERSNC